MSKKAEEGQEAETTRRERDQGGTGEGELAQGARHGDLAVRVCRNCSRWRFGVRKSFGELRGI